MIPETFTIVLDEEGRKLILLALRLLSTDDEVVFDRRNCLHDMLSVAESGDVVNDFTL